MINLLIGIFFVYLILSMLASGIQEAIAGWIRLRGKMLLGAIEQMLSNKTEDEKVDTSLFTSFINTKWFQSLKRNKLTWLQSILPIKKEPSYLKDNTFSSIVLQALGSSANLKEVEGTVSKMDDGSLKTFLMDLIGKADNDIEKFKSSITTWYDSTMSEVSSWYKSRAHTMLFIIGFILAAILNADTFSMYNKLSNDPATQAQLVKLAEDYVNNGGFERSEIINDTILLDTNTVAITPRIDTALTSLDSLRNEIVGLVDNNLKSIYTPLGLGWKKAEFVGLADPIKLFMKLLGILITSFAIAMGASFWFNLIKNLLSFRSSRASSKDSEGK